MSKCVSGEGLDHGSNIRVMHRQGEDKTCSFLPGNSTLSLQGSHVANKFSKENILYFFFDILKLFWVLGVNYM